MYPPSRRRPKASRAFREGVVQIIVTRACNLACFNCTQGSNLRGKAGMMTPAQFEQAVDSLEGYWGVYGVFGGSPCFSPHFAEYCRILRERVPKEQCGLWSNNLNGHGAICRQTFSPHCSNLNVHMQRDAYDEMRRDWPESRPFGLQEDSRHSPPFVAMLDVIESEEERWNLISKCDINVSWSSAIAVVRGELRAFFCEIAAAQAVLHQDDPDWPDTGLPVEKGWWKRPMADYAEQVRWNCHRCGVPLRGHGELAQSKDGVEQCSKTHANVYRPKTPGREVQVVDNLVQLNLGKIQDMTKYVQNSHK